ncbi:pyridoxal-dependent decarboxylase [Mesorhizobium sp. Root157]|nr:pyridoxal-dependent decarboxylase [Mesorhizobium sp. Root157]
MTALFSRASAHALSFRTSITDRPQRPERSYGEMRQRFEAPVPETGDAGPDVLEELARLAAPGLHATTGPRFFGWVIGGSHPVGVAADWLASAWGQNAGNHTAAPAAAAAEAVAAAWMLDLLHLPRQASVGFVTGATMANFVCLTAARDAVLRHSGWDVEQKGLSGSPPIRVLIGDDAHTTVFSALHYLGFGRDNLARVATDARGAMSMDDFEAKLGEAEGAVIVITQAGQINTGAFDPHQAIVPLARSRDAWIHVDGAFGLWARACPSRASLAQGVEAADSWATDGHKWLQTPYDCGYAFVRDAEAHRRAMTIAASYLPPVNGSERDPSHYVPELSRRARGFATWAMLKHLGRQGVAELVDRHCTLAALMAGLLRAEPGVAILNEVVLNQVLVRFGDAEPADTGDKLTLSTIERLQQDGTCFAGVAKWRDRWAMRLSVIGYSTTEDDIRRSAEAILQCWRDARAQAS